MQSNLQRMNSIGAMLFFLLGLASSAWATTGAAGGIPWQVGDIVVCFGGGQCNVLRIVNGSPVLLDQISDSLTGATRGVAIDNTLHLLATDNASSSNTGSNVVVYTIASVNPNTNTAIAHTPLHTFSGDGANVQAIAINSAGHIFVGNVGGTGPSITELTPQGTLASPSALKTNPLPLPANCNVTTGQPLSMDLSANGLSLYLTSGGASIQQLTLASGTCTPFANFGSGETGYAGEVTLYGIKDIPAGALPASNGMCNGANCPSDETLLVVASGFIDYGGNSFSDADAVNICTAVAGGPAVSCGLLLDTNSTDPGLTAQLWQPNDQYFATGTKILDQKEQVQSVYTAGTSGSDEPSFNDSTGGGLTIDNAVKWTDIAQPMWQMSHAYTATGMLPAPTVAAVPGTYFVDPNGNLETVTVAGTSGSIEPGVTASPANPAFWSTSPGGMTIDGLVWQDQGAWQANHLYSTLLTPVGDSSGHVHEVLTAGTSGGLSMPSGGWNDIRSTNGELTAAGVTIDNAVIWTNEGPVQNYNQSYFYGLGTYIAPNGRIEKAIEPGTSGGMVAVFNVGGQTMDGGVTWVDQGKETWHPNFLFASGAVVVDGNGHLQQVTTAGTSGPTVPPFTSNIPVSGETTDGLQWNDEGVPATWISGTAFSVNQFIVDNSGTPHVQQVVVSGKTGGSEGPFNTSGGYTVDGTVVWLDRGVATYQPGHTYNVGDAFFDGKDVQQVLTAGTAGGSAPSFTDSPPAITPDNVAVWQDEGTPTWIGNGPRFTYAANSFIIDPAGHVQETAAGGTSGGSMPTFNDDNLAAEGVYDGLVWQDIGPVLTWNASTTFTASAVYPFTLVIGNGYVQQATTAGISGTPNPPTWNATVGGMTVDGLQWTDQGTSVWVANTQYFTLGALISDPATHAQKVIEAGTSGSGPSTPAGGWNDSGGTTIDNAVTWTESHPSRAPSTMYVLNAIVLDTYSPVNVQQATLAGTTGPNGVTFNDSGRSVIDGLQWINSTATSSVVARYPVTGATTLQALALDPLVTDCSSGQGNGSNTAACALTYTSAPKVTMEGESGERYGPGFWLADSQSASFYHLDFATGTPINFDASITTNPPCTSPCTQVTGIQGIGIYGGEGSNQPDLAKLFASPDITTLTNQTAAVEFLQNLENVTLYNGTSPSPVALYASVAGSGTCFNDAGTVCRATTPVNRPDGTEGIVWKIDIPVGGTTLPAAAIVASKYSTDMTAGLPATHQAIDNGTDAFTDMAYDTTNMVGNNDPSQPKKSVHTLHEVVNAQGQIVTQTGGCFYLAPAPPGACFESVKNLKYIPFVVAFACPKLSFSQFKGLNAGPPQMSLVQTFSTVKTGPVAAPQPSTTGTVPYQPVPNQNIPVLYAATVNWQTLVDGNYSITTFDPTGTVVSFVTTFTKADECSKEGADQE